MKGIKSYLQPQTNFHIILLIFHPIDTIYAISLLWAENQSNNWKLTMFLTIYFTRLVTLLVGQGQLPHWQKWIILFKKHLFSF
jgi:hypothetical protein